MNEILTEICSDGKLTFGEILKLIFQGIRDVISAIDVDIYSTGTVGISLWELLLGFLTVAIIFGFFLKSRAGSVFGALNNINEHEKAQQREADRVQAREYRAKQLEYYRSRMNGGK